ncbi:sensor histidine kinase [Cohnella hongkongensis]|uniref:histidine kinase n=1 Tax=Cohnella hongkongensis TaxID=178337 RepID=A0ABV9F9T6_9BACL
MRRGYKTMQKLFKSLQNKILFVFVILILPLFVLLIYYNFYSGEVIRNQVAHSNGNLLRMYMGTIDRELEDVNKYLFSLVAQEPDLLALNVSEADDPEAYHLARIRLSNRLLANVVYYDKVEMFFIYSLRNEDLLAVETQLMPYQEKESLKNEIVALFDRAGVPEGSEWFLHRSREFPSLYRVIRYGDVYIGALMNIGRLMVPFESTDLGEDGKILMLDSEYQPVTNGPEADEPDLQLQGAFKSAYEMTGSKNRFMAVGERSRQGQFGVVALISDKPIMENIPYLRRLVWLIAVATVIVLPVVYLFLRRIVLVPMKRIISAMRKIRAGDWETRLSGPASSREFSIINETFNTMVSQIKELKINVYEEQLNSQKAELKHLQLQINPHFFLNSLNIVYHLAEVKNYSLIQEIALSLVQYFRFMFRSNLSFVSVRDELEHTRNYLRIQEMRFPEKLSSEVSVEDRLLEKTVPPLVCQTFVENAIKHAISMDGSLRITVKVSVDRADPRYMRIEIRDTGRGFPPEVLERLGRKDDIGEGQGVHIGIWNIRNRLRLLYPDGDADLGFANGPNQGAVVQIRLPIRDSEREEAGADVSSAARR